MARYVGAANNGNWQAVATAHQDNTNNSKRTTKTYRDMYVSIGFGLGMREELARGMCLVQ